MTARVLPKVEWPRLETLPWTGLSQVWRSLPDTTQILVVEDTEAAIIGAWSLSSVYLAEGVGIDPAHRKHGRVAIALIRGLNELASGLLASAVMTTADSDEIRDLLTRLKATDLVSESGDYLTVHLMPVVKE